MFSDCWKHLVRTLRTSCMSKFSQLQEMPQQPWEQDNRHEHLTVCFPYHFSLHCWDTTNTVAFTISSAEYFPRVCLDMLKIKPPRGTRNSIFCITGHLKVIATFLSGINRHSRCSHHFWSLQKIYSAPPSGLWQLLFQTLTISFELFLFFIQRVNVTLQSAHSRHQMLVLLTVFLQQLFLPVYFSLLALK